MHSPEDINVGDLVRVSFDSGRTGIVLAIDEKKPVWTHKIFWFHPQVEYGICDWMNPQSLTRVIKDEK